jgi:hypothetical protein
MTKIGSLGHLLALNEVRVRVERACRDLGWSLRLWLDPHELGPILARSQLIADAYFQIQRTVEGETKTSAFFLELERANKSSRVVESKLQRYADLYYSGDYESHFGTRALRVLVVFTDELGLRSQPRIVHSLKTAEHLGVTLARFTGLSNVKDGSPSDLLTSSVWWHPFSWPHRRPRGITTSKSNGGSVGVSSARLPATRPLVAILADMVEAALTADSDKHAPAGGIQFLRQSNGDET